METGENLTQRLHSPRTLVAIGAFSTLLTLTAESTIIHDHSPRAAITTANSESGSRLLTMRAEEPPTASEAHVPGEHPMRAQPVQPLAAPNVELQKTSGRFAHGNVAPGSTPASLRRLKVDTLLRIHRTAYNPKQEKAIRTRLQAVAETELAKHVHETRPDAGPRINVYTAHHPENWCADWVGYDYHVSNVGFSGGVTYHDDSPDWKLSRVYPNPHNHPEVISLYEWFEHGGYVFKPGQRVPKVGDVVFMRLGPRPTDYHTGVSGGVTADGTLIVYEGNTANNALEKKYYPDYLHMTFIIGFGSLFKS